MAYELFYWDGLQGRGEFIRLALEDAEAAYIDVGRGDEKDGQGLPAIMAFLRGKHEQLPFAPPFLRDGEIVVSHVANILMYLGPKLGLSPSDEAHRLFANGLQLTITDMVMEVHDTHHPLSVGDYYEDQKDAAKIRSKAFLSERLPKFLGYFEMVLKHNPQGDAHSVGAGHSYVDLSLFQLIEGLRYAFPRAMRDFGTSFPALGRLHQRVQKRPNIQRYLQSERRIAFNETGIFRHYPELDIDVDKAS